MKIIRNAHTYKRSAPDLFNYVCEKSDLRQWFLARLCEPVAECPAEGSYSLNGCYLLNGQHALSADGAWLPDSILDHGPAEQMLPMMRHVISGRHYKAENFDDCIHTAVIYKSGGANYGHFLTDIAPKVVNIARAGHRHVRYLIPDDAGWSWPLLSDISRLFGIAAERYDCTGSQLSAVSGATFYTPVSRHNDGPRKSHALLDLRQMLLNAYGSHQASRKLYVRRGNDYTRNISNGAEIAKLFEEAGFEGISPERYPFAEQVRIFSSASHIVGTVGAAMTNTLFAPATCQILMIDPGIGDRYFWDLSCLTGQRFHWLFASALDHYTPERAAQPFHVDVDSVLSTLKALDWPLRQEQRQSSLALIRT